jgi:cell filamentation protein
LPFDPFNDFEERGYLRNHFRIKDIEEVRRLENSAFQDCLFEALTFLRRRSTIVYEDVLTTNRILFEAVYPWAGQSREILAPTLAIGRAGFKEFAYPNEIGMATSYALSASLDDLSSMPGTVFARLAYAHPFLDTNGRTLLTVHSEMMRRAAKHILWNELPTDLFLKSLTDAIENQSRALDDAIMPLLREGGLAISKQQKIIIEATGTTRK